MGVIALGQAMLGDPLRPTGAFGDILAGQFEVDAAWIGALGVLSTYRNEAGNFLQSAGILRLKQPFGRTSPAARFQTLDHERRDTR